jgi:trk system potassium uptake protein TrkH
MALIVVGGLGFLTLEELTLWRRGRREADSGRPPPSGTDHRSGRFRLSTHSQLVLITSGVLIAVGAVAITAFEWTNTLAALPPADRLVNGLFASITTRTAGFNTIDYAAAHPSTNFLTIILMSIGGAPGSTAGGLKVTTFALLGLLAWSRLRGRSTTNFAGRTIPPGTVQRATGLFVLVIGVVVVGLFGYSATELTSLLSPDPHGRFFDHLFEAVSAFNTVGLSMGVTDALTNPGRLLTVVLMFIGRVGPLTVAAALSRAETRSNADVRYAYEDVVVG